MDLQLSGQVTVIVGGARGLGHAIASAFSAEGAHVAIVDRDPESLAVAEALAGSGRALAAGFVGDVTDYAAMRTVAEGVHGTFGRCDHVIFAAGIGSGKFGFPFWNLDPSDWDRVLRVNLIGAANVAHAYAPKMA